LHTTHSGSAGQFGVAEIAVRTVCLAIMSDKVRAASRSEQRLQSRDVGIADRIHADPTDHEV
jgi:hypothetical protein